MSTRPFLAFACAHLTDERLYAHQIEALSATHDCKVFVFREQASMAAMAEHLLAHTPERFTLIGLSLGGYMAFEVIRQALHRLERLVLIDTTAVADHPARRDGRLRDIATVRQNGIEALIPELPSRWLLPAHTQDAALVELMSSMARSVGRARSMEPANRHAGPPGFPPGPRRCRGSHVADLRPAGPGHATVRPRGHGCPRARCPPGRHRGLRSPVDHRTTCVSDASAA